MKTKDSIFIIALCCLCNVARAQVAAPAWQLTSAPGQSWRSVACSADGTKLIASASSGGPVYLSTNSGATWTTSSLSVTPVIYASHAVASSADGTVLAALSSTTIYVSTDSGATWTAGQTTTNVWMSIAMSADGTKMVAVDQNLAGANIGEIYSSSDSGTSWILRSTGQPWQDVASSADGTKLIAVCGNQIGDYTGNIYLSTDAGTNWTENPGIGEPVIWTSAAISADGTKMFASEISSFGAPPQFGQVHYSTDSGAEWDLFGANSPYLTWVNVACSTNGYYLFVTSARQISSVGIGPSAGVVYTSTNWDTSTTTWQPAYAPDANWRSIAASADGTKLYAASSSQGSVDVGGIYAYTSPSTNAPAMNIASGGGNAFISWPWPSSGYVLQVNTNLATTNWVTLSNVVSVVNQAIMPQTNANAFYRLQMP